MDQKYERGAGRTKKVMDRTINHDDRNDEIQANGHLHAKCFCGEWNE